MDIRKRNIVLTGCCSGFGATVRRNLIDQGHSVLGVGVEGPDVKADFNHQHPMDVWRAISDIMPQADVLINNAGITAIDFLETHSVGDFSEVLNVNLVFPFVFTREFCKQVRQRYVSELPPTDDECGRVVFTGSMSTLMSMRGSVGYVASKAGVEAMCRTLAKEYAGKKPEINFYAVSPGMVENTGMSRQAVTALQTKRGMTSEEAIKYSTQSPMGRNATHDEVWKMFDFTVNHAPAFATGAVFRMPSGMGL